MPGGYRLLDTGHSMPVSGEVEEGEKHREGFLHPQDSAEWPLAMELDYRIQHWWIACDSAVGNDMLTGVVALGWAGPEKQSVVQR